MHHESTAQEIISFAHSCLFQQYALRQRETDMENYINSGDLPPDSCGYVMPSYGIGNRYFRPIAQKLKNTVLFGPAPFEAKVNCEDYGERIAEQRRLTNVLGREAKRKSDSLTKSVAGRFILMGAAYAYRLDRNDVQYQFGRPLVDADDPSDIYDDRFNRWVIEHTVRLSDIEKWIKHAKGDGSDGGWCKEGLENLKKYILEDKQEQQNRSNVSRIQNDRKWTDLNNCHDKLTCFVEFRKSDEFHGRRRKIDIRIVSRYTENQYIHSGQKVDKVNRKITPTKTLKIDCKKENEQVLYAKKGAFHDIDECLIQWCEDARISGDQMFNAIEGDPKHFMRRLAEIEYLTDAVIKGVGFGSQINFTYNNSVVRESAKRVAQGGLRPYHIVPTGIGVLDKSGALQGSSAATNLIDRLGLGLEEESANGKLPQFQGNKAGNQFKAEAEANIQQEDEALSNRMASWFDGWDTYWEQVGKTYARKMVPDDHSYRDIKWFREEFEKAGGSLKNISEETVILKARRIPGGSDRQNAIQKFSSVVNNPNSRQQDIDFAMPQLMTLLFGPEYEEYIMGEDRKEVDQDQLSIAYDQSANSMATGMPAPPNKDDKSAVHLERVHMPILQNEFKRIAQKGQRSPDDDARVSGLVGHIQLDIARLPGANRDRAMQMLAQIGQAYQQIPVQATMDEQAMKMREEQRKDAKLQHEISMGQNLAQNRNVQTQAKLDNQGFSQRSQLVALAQQGERIGVEKDRQKTNEVKVVNDLQQPIAA